MFAAMRFSRFLLPLFALSLIAAAKKPQQTIRFHIEANPNGGSSFTLSAKLPDSSQSISISKAAEISESDVEAIYPFPAANGTMGCALKLDEHGRIALDALSQEYHGGLLIGFYNGRPVTAMQIDRRIPDGIIYIRQGILPQEIELLRKMFPVLGEKKQKKSAHKTAEASVPIPAPAVPQPALPSASLPRGD